jgi:hypothetical protein
VLPRRSRTCSLDIFRQRRRKTAIVRFLDIETFFALLTNAQLELKIQNPGAPALGRLQVKPVALSVALEELKIEVKDLPLGPGEAQGESL